MTLSILVYGKEEDKLYIGTILGVLQQQLDRIDGKKNSELTVQAMLSDKLTEEELKRELLNKCAAWYYVYLPVKPGVKVARKYIDYILETIRRSGGRPEILKKHNIFFKDMNA